MTMKLVANRFRTRKVDVPAPQAAPQPAPQPAPQARPAPVVQQMQRAPQQATLGQITPAQIPAPSGGRKIPTGEMFTEAPDGFGNMNFATARKAPVAAPAPADDAAAMLDAIRREGLTGRQLRMARRLAQKHNMPATSDFDAVRLLRNAGIDPFQTNSALELVSSADQPAGASPSRELALSGGTKLPQTTKPAAMPSVEDRAAESHIAEVSRIQRDIVKRRRAKTLEMIVRMAVFVALPTLLAGFYFYNIATPFYATKTEFIIQKADPVGSPNAGLGGLAASPMANAQDSITVQGYLQSQAAMMRLDEDNGFRTKYSDPSIDRLQRLDPEASNTAAYKKYRKNIKISFDPTEGIVKMEVIAPNPQVAVDISKSLISYAEEQVDQLTARQRDDQMAGAQKSYQEAEAKLDAANERVVILQEKNKVLSSDVEISLITSQIGALDAQLSQDRLSLAQMESNENPNVARMEPLKRRITTLESEIAILRSKLTENSADGLSIARVQSELFVAQADVETRRALLAKSLEAMETARTAANRQTRYLSISVNPIAADEAAYPRAFENTLVVLLIFAGLYLILSMTAAVLREQVAS